MVGEALAGGAVLAGGLINSAANIYQANKQMRFQERMSSTAHQRETQDLIKAGLNPLLSLKAGGASSPPGARGEVDIQAGQAVSSALQASMQSKQKDLIDAQINQSNSAAALTAAQAKQIESTLPHSIEKIKAEIGSLVSGTAVSQAQVPEIAQRIAESLERIKLLEKQTESEDVRMQKEKALKVLWKALEDLLKGADQATRLNLIPKVEEVIRPHLPWLPFGTLFMKKGGER